MNNLELQPYDHAKVAELAGHAKRLGILIHIAGVPFGKDVTASSRLLLAAAAETPTSGDGVSPDYVMVPREPTEAMCLAGENCDGNSGPGPWLDGGHKPENVERIYRAMLSAAPPSPRSDDGAPGADVEQFPANRIHRLPVNLPFERLPECSCDPGVGVRPPCTCDYSATSTQSISEAPTSADAVNDKSWLETTIDKINSMPNPNPEVGEMVERLKKAAGYLRIPKITVVGPVQEIELRHALSTDDAASLLIALDAERGRMREALKLVLTGGNHLANILIGKLGGGFSDAYPPSMDTNTALEKLGPTDTYDVWCCWSAIMRARSALPASDEK